MTGKIRKLTSLATAFVVVCLVVAGFPQFDVVIPPVVLASPAAVTYYFDAHDATLVWDNFPDNMTNGTI